MFQYSNRSLGPVLQESELKLRLGAPKGAQKWPKRVQKLPKIGILAIFRCLIGPLVAKLLHILVEQVISFDLST